MKNGAWAAWIAVGLVAALCIYMTKDPAFAWLFLIVLLAY